MILTSFNQAKLISFLSLPLSRVVSLLAVTSLNLSNWVTLLIFEKPEKRHLSLVLAKTLATPLRATKTSLDCSVSTLRMVINGISGSLVRMTIYLVLETPLASFPELLALLRSVREPPGTRFDEKLLFILLDKNY